MKERNDLFSITFLIFKMSFFWKLHEISQRYKLRNISWNTRKLIYNMSLIEKLQVKELFNQVIAIKNLLSIAIILIVFRLNQVGLATMLQWSWIWSCTRRLLHYPHVYLVRVNGKAIRELTSSERLSLSYYGCCSVSVPSLMSKIHWLIITLKDRKSLSCSAISIAVFSNRLILIFFVWNI